MPITPVSGPAAARRLTTVLKRIVSVGDEEVEPLLWSCLFLSSLLAGNYVLRPLRDEMGIAGGARYLPWMFAGTLAAMLLAHRVFARFVTGERRPQVVPGLCRFAQVNLLVFFVLDRLTPDWGIVYLARALFIWASVYNLFIVSVAWGLLTDRFDNDQARRLFGFIAAGGTLGAIAGSGLTALLVERVGTTNLLVLAVIFLEVGVVAVRHLQVPRAIRDSLPSEASACERVQWENASPRGYLLGLSLNILLFTITSALIYLEQARIVAAAFQDPSDRTAFFARIDLLVNIVGLVIQVFLTGRFIAALGVGGTAALLPAVTLIGFLALQWRATTVTLLWFQVARRAVDYALARPSREVMYTVVRRIDRYRAKSFIDTAVYRAGDSVGAWAFALLTALPGQSGSLTLAILGLSVGWTILNLGLGRWQQRLAARKVGSL